MNRKHEVVGRTVNSASSSDPVQGNRASWQAEDVSTRYRVGALITHGTAKPAGLRQVVPADKRDREVFWVREVVSRLEEFAAETLTIRANADDSDGGHDVLIERPGQPTIGVQVTELTHELQRGRAGIRQEFVRRVLHASRQAEPPISERVVATLMVANEPAGALKLPPERIISAVQEIVRNRRLETIVPFEVGALMVQRLESAIPYVPTEGNLSFDVNFDQIPVGLETYANAIDGLREKKARSRSQWLLIWSREFWKDKHWLEEPVVTKFEKTFGDSLFERVYFVESMDAEGLFAANISVHCVKRPACSRPAAPEGLR